MEFNRDIPIYLCNLDILVKQLITEANLRARTQEGKPKDEHCDWFAEV
jgi:hypothetical protein